jgi:tRNA pseudouridine55 synthase
VTIHELTLLEWDATDPDRPIAIVDVACSAGTYVRALARDVGARLGSAGYLGALRRTAAGTFTEHEAVGMDVIRAAASGGPEGLEPLLRPVDTGLDRFPVVRLSGQEVEAVSRGQAVRPGAGFETDAERYRLYADDGRLAAIAVPIDGGRLAPDKVLISARPVVAGAS